MIMDNQKIYLAGFALCVAGALASCVYSAIAAATLFGVLIAEQMADLLSARTAR